MGEYASVQPMHPEQVAALLMRLTPSIIWTWLLISLAGLWYATRLWLRARRDYHRQAQSGFDGLMRYLAQGNLRRVRVRVWMFLGFLLIGVFALGLSIVPEGLIRELVRFLYVFLFLAINFLLLYNAREDEQHDRVLRVLLRREERIASHEYPDTP
jgi:hypothetical protein